MKVVKSISQTKRPRLASISCIWILAAMLAVFMPLFAGTTGKIAGVIKDSQSGEALPGVNVFIENELMGSATDGDGYYYVLNVPPGTYTVIAQLIGYKETRITNVKVNVDLTTQINFDLQTEAVEGDEVVVVADRPLIQKDLTSSSVQITADEIEALPVDNFGEVVALQAGVVAGHFRGGRTGEVSYMVDGIPVNDPFNNSIAIEVENSSIQQLEVISGTFNAEYGQAMSGIVNIVTKEGSNKYEGQVSAYASSFYSTHEDVFLNLNEFDLDGAQNFQGSLSGPIPFLKKVRFFATARALQDDGFLYGARAYKTSDNEPLFPSGDSSIVSMNPSEELSLHTKLTYYLTPALKLNYGFLWNDNENRYYDHAFRLAPDGLMNHFRNNWNHNIVVNHGLSNSTFYTMRFARNFSDYEGYLYEDPLDERYEIPEWGQPQSNYTFRSGGNQTWRYNRNTTTSLAKFDLSSQVSKEHKIGIGFLYRTHDVYSFGTGFFSEVVGFNAATLEDIYDIRYPAEFAPGREEYDRSPREFSAYLQDKMEYDDFIINAGLRLDYFDPNSDILSDNRNPEFNELFPAGNVAASTKLQLSPRLGVAFPISTKGVIHVSYGHFFQIPNFELLYQGINDFPDGSTRFAIEKTSLNTIIGNPDIDAQRTVTYEMGLKQEMATNLGLEFTAYYRDIRNLVGTEIIETYDQNKYARYINVDYGNVLGIILSMEKRFADYWGMRVDYTYQIAKGNASDPRSAFFDNQANPPREPEKQLSRLDWDQRSTLNVSLNTGKPGNWTIGFVSKIGSGSPYTSDVRFTGVNVNFQNNRVKPTSVLFDARAEKTLTIAGTKVSTFLWVQNLFDRLNEWGVYGSSGRANNDLNTQFAGDIIGINTIDEYVTNPTFYSPPRQIRLGMSFGF